MLKMASKVMKLSNSPNPTLAAHSLSDQTPPRLVAFTYLT